MNENNKKIEYKYCYNINTWNLDDVICPYCKHVHTDCYHYSDTTPYKEERYLDCKECGKRFKLSVSGYRMSYSAEANCEYNEEKHDFVKKEIYDLQSVFPNGYWYECQKCGERWIFTQEEYDKYEEWWRNNNDIH